MPPLLAVSGSEGINILRNTPSVLATLHDNIRAARAVLDKVDCISIPSHPASPIIHIHIRPIPSATLQPSTAPFSPSSKQSPAAGREAARHAIEQDERLLQDVVDEALAQGVLITRTKYPRGQEANEPKPSIRLALTSALTRKETEKAVGVMKAALIKVLNKRR
jgi:serine palmitoyltransferase